MEFHLDDGEVITNKPEQTLKTQQMLAVLASQGQCDSSFPSSVASLSEASSQRNITTNTSSFKKLSRSSQDLQNLMNTSTYICASYNFLGKCVNKDCKKKHTRVSIESGLSELISENLELLDSYEKQGHKLKLPPQGQDFYFKMKNGRKESKSEIKNIQKQSLMNRKYEIQFPPENGYESLYSSQQTINSNKERVSHRILKLQPQLDFKILSSYFRDNSPNQVDGQVNFRKDIVIKLKQEIDKTQDKLKTIKILNQWVQSQEIDEEQFYDLYDSRNLTQQYHMKCLINLLKLQVPDLSSHDSDDNKSSFNQP